MTKWYIVIRFIFRFFFVVFLLSTGRVEKNHTHKTKYYSRSVVGHTSAIERERKMPVILCFVNFTTKLYAIIRLPVFDPHHEMPAIYNTTRRESRIHLESSPEPKKQQQQNILMCPLAFFVRCLSHHIFW